MIRFDCPSCGKSLSAPDGAEGRDGRCTCGATFSIPGHGGPAEPIELDDEPILYRRRKSYAPPALVVVGVLLLAGVTVVVAIAAIMRASAPPEKPREVAKKKDVSAPGRAERPVAQVDEREPVRGNPRARDRSSDDEDAGWSTSAILGVVAVVVLAYLVFVVLLAIWVIRDCRNRSIENGIFWMLLIFPFNVLALIIYLASRPNGTLVRCEHCRNQRLAFVGVCPHCHCDVRPRGAGPD